MAILVFVIELLALGVLFQTIYGALYRLYLSPVAKFPGPRLAAVTFWYEFYFDVVRGGSYVHEIARMHDRYGPIVRINPYELHVRDNDLDFINRLYPAVGKEVDKFWWSARMFGSTEMAFTTVPHALHRMRRNAFGKFFSTAYIRRLEPTIAAIINGLCARIEANVQAGKVVNLVHALSALTQDVIMEYCFADPRGVVDMEDFAPQYYEAEQTKCQFTPVIKQFPWLIPILERLPDWCIRTMNPIAWAVRLKERFYIQQIQRIIDSGDADLTSHVTVFHELSNNQDLPTKEKSPERLAKEATSIVGAGTLTTAHTLSLMVFFVLQDPTLSKRLRDELVKATLPGQDVPPLDTLEKLPVLSAVVNEGLRLSYGVMHRLTRVHPQSTLQFREWTIPPNTPVGMTPYFLHTDPAIFPDPRSFRVERWLDLEPAPRDHLTRYLNNFGRGSRQCVGMRLAHAEIYMTVAYIVRRLTPNLQLYDTEYERDVEYVRDYLLPAPSLQSRGVRVVQARTSKS